MRINKTVPLFLAPMAGVGDRAFREICGAFGVDFFCSEMISAKALSFGDKKSLPLTKTGEKDRPIALQLFGSDPIAMERGAVRLAELGNGEWIDLNFGCPVPKIAGNGDGCALMKAPDLCYEIVRRVVLATPLPVSVKLRAGWDGEHLNAPEIARLCEKAGAKRIAVHGRCREDFYREGTVRRDVICRVKDAVTVPVIANGDIKNGQSALEMLEETECDGLMIGRAALGAPWVFAQIRSALAGEDCPKFSRKEVIEKHLELAFSYKKETAGREMRMHLAYYLKGFRGAASLRDSAMRCERKEEYLALLSHLEET